MFSGLEKGSEGAEDSSYDVYLTVSVIDTDLSSSADCLEYLYVYE